MLRLLEFQRRPKALIDYITWAALIGPGLVLNKDGSLQRTCKYRGPDLESATPEQLVSFTARMNNLLKRFGSGWALFFEAARRTATDYPASRFDDAASWLVDEERRGQFEAVGHHFETDFYLTLCWMPPADRAGRIETLLIDDPSDAPQAFWQDSRRYYETETLRAFDQLETLMPEARWLNDSETLTYLHSAVSTKRHTVAAPHTPMGLDHLLVDCALRGGLSPQLGSQTLKVISLNGFPSMTEPGLLAELDGLGFAYRWTTRFLPLDKPEAEKILTRQRRHYFAKRKSLMTVLKETLENEPSQLMNTDALNKAAEIDAALQALGADHVSYGYMTTSLVLMDEDPNRAAEKARAAEQVLNGRGFVTIDETLNAVDAWFGSHPGNSYANIRQPLLSTLNLAHMTPLSALWAGPEQNEHLGAAPLLIARSGSDTPFRLVTHQGDVGHTLIVGPTGAGKSVLLSLLALQFRRYTGAQVFVFDKGRSARAAMLAMGGADYELDLSGRLAFQPLGGIDTDETLAFAQDWVLGLLEQENVKIDPAVRETVWSALQNLAGTPREQRTLTGLSALIQSSALREALKPYTLNGPYGALLDADADSLQDGRLAVFEMETLMQSPRLAPPVLSYLFHRLEARFDGSPTLLILDEAWLFLDHPLFAARLREWLKTLRKKNVSVVMATQSLSDVSRSAIAPTLMESCPTRIFLANPRAEEPQQSEIYEAFGLNARQVDLIGRATPKRDYYLQCPAGNRMFDLELGPIGLAFCAAGSKADQTAMDALVADAPPGGFASAWLTERGLGWAADLIPQSDTGGVPCAAE